MLGKFGQLLRAVAGGPDPAAIPSPSEIIPTVELAKCPTDWYYPQDIFIYGGWADEAAGVALRSQVALLNPTGSRAICTVEHLAVRHPSTVLSVAMAVEAQVAAFDNDGFEYLRDARIRRLLVNPYPTRGPACRVITDQAASAGNAVNYLMPDHDDGTHYYYHHNVEYVLVPGTALVVVGNNDNEAIRVSFDWRERAVDPEELRGSPFSV